MPSMLRNKRKTIRLPKEAYRNGHPFFITICTYQRRPYFADHPPLADELTMILKACAEQRKAKLYAWCIMPDHIHLLVEDSDIQQFIRGIKGRCTPIARQLLSGEKLWQRSYYDHAAREDESVNQIAVYIWNNPVRRRLVVCPSQYPISGSLDWPDWRDWFTGAV